MTLPEFDIEAAWNAAFEAEVAEQREKTDVDSCEWRAAGRVTKDKPNKEDGEWWKANGLDFCKNFPPWFQEGGWKPWEASPGRFAVELGLMAQVGDWQVKAYIDALLVSRTGELTVHDWKSGTSDPDSNLQLGIYATLVEKVFGVRPSYGFYWKARKGESLAPVSLDMYTEDFLAEFFNETGEGNKNKRFPPHLGNKCKYMCSTRAACYAFSGDTPETRKYDPLNPFFLGNMQREITITKGA